MRIIGTNQKYVNSIGLILFMGLFFIPVTNASATIESHGMCAVNELPHPFNGTPPQDRRVFEAGEQVCVWLIFGGDDSTEFNLRLEWYQPDGSKMTPGSSTTRTQYYDNWKILFSETGGGIPNIRGKWTVKVFDYFSYSSRWLYDETFYVGGGGIITTTTTISDCPPDYPIDCGDGGCCSSDYPVCGRGINSDSCFPEGTNPYFPDCPILNLYSEASKEVQVLRNFRDNVLSKTQEGRELIKLYYQWSPFIVRAMEADEEFKQEVKDMVDGVLGVVEVE